MHPTALVARFAACVVMFLSLCLAQAHAQYKVLHSFGSSTDDGQTPEAGLTFDANGNLHGTTCCGGLNGAGTAFKLTRNPDGSWTEDVTDSFNSGEGTYGVTSNQNQGWGGTGPQAFANPTGEAAPSSDLVSDAAGNLYGTRFDPGQDGGGTVFKRAHNPDGTWTESVVYTFEGRDDGYLPNSVTVDSAGNLYGTASLKGHFGCGTLFKLTPTAHGPWTETTLHAFSCDSEGYLPLGGVTLDSKGNLYGVANQGGKNGYGVVWEFVR